MEVEEGAERADDEWHRALDGRITEIAGAEIEPLGNAFVRGRLACDREHALGRVDADDVHSGLGDRDGDPAGTDAELDDGAAGALRLLDVEVDVLADAPAPRVVDRRDRVVGVAPRRAISALFGHRRVRVF